VGNLSLRSVKQAGLGISETGHDEQGKKHKLYNVFIEFYKFSVTE